MRSLLAGQKLMTFCFIINNVSNGAGRGQKKQSQAAQNKFHCTVDFGLVDI